MNNHTNQTNKSKTENLRKLLQGKTLLMQTTGLSWVEGPWVTPPPPTLESQRPLESWLHAIKAMVTPTISRQQDPFPTAIPEVNLILVGTNEQTTQIKATQGQLSTSTIESAPATDRVWTHNPSDVTQILEIVSLLETHHTATLVIPEESPFQDTLNLWEHLVTWITLGAEKATLSNTIQHCLTPLLTRLSIHPVVQIKTRITDPELTQLLLAMMCRPETHELLLEVPTSAMKDLKALASNSEDIQFKTLNHPHLKDVYVTVLESPLTVSLIHTCRATSTNPLSYLPEHHRPLGINPHGHLGLENDHPLLAHFNLDRYVSNPNDLIQSDSLESHARDILKWLDDWLDLRGTATDDHLYCTQQSRSICIIPKHTSWNKWTVEQKTKANQIFHQAFLQASQELAAERGAYPLYQSLHRHIQHNPRRHLSLFLITEEDQKNATFDEDPPYLLWEAEARNASTTVAINVMRSHDALDTLKSVIDTFKRGAIWVKLQPKEPDTSGTKTTAT